MSSWDADTEQVEQPRRLSRLSVSACDNQTSVKATEDNKDEESHDGQRKGEREKDACVFTSSSDRTSVERAVIQAGLEHELR